MRSRPGILVSAAVFVAVALALVGCASDTPTDAPSDTNFAPPPAGAGFDYQLGASYDLPADATVVARDRTADPSVEHYSICYLNAYQTQPGELEDWPAEAILADEDGQAVRDPDWPDEVLLNISDPDGRETVIRRVSEWIRTCAADGFDAVEFDNLDSFTRSDGAITESDALAVARRLVEVAHDSGLAAAQKNAAEHAAAFRSEAGFDFAIAEECAAYDECVAYTDAYGTAVLDIEYTDTLPRTFAEMCADAASPASMILRDRDLGAPDDPAYVRDVC